MCKVLITLARIASDGEKLPLLFYDRLYAETNEKGLFMRFINKLLPTLGILAVSFGCTTDIALAKPNDQIVRPSLPADHWQPPQRNAVGKKNGQVLKVRKAVLNRIPFLDTTQIAFKSTDSFGAPIVATTTIVRPPNVRKNAPIMSLQHFINAIGTNCSPSQVLVHPSAFDEWWDISIPAIINAAMVRGVVVALPDHLGPQMVYPGGPIGGHITLDGLRAVRDYFHMYKSRMTLLGYSGGSISTGFASIQKRSYAPELNVVGAALGGAPVDIMSLFKILNHHQNEHSPVVGIVFMAALGMERQYPGLRVSPRLSPRGKQLRNRVNNACVKEVTTISTEYTLKELMKPGTDVWGEDLQPLKDVSLSYHKEVPTVPTMFFNSRGDELIPYNDVLKLTKRYCRAHAPVQLRSMTIPEHITSIFESIDFVTRFIDKRNAGAPFYDDCSSILAEPLV